MARPLPSDVVCRGRVLQRLEVPIGTCTFQDNPAGETIGIIVIAHWIDRFGVLFLEWSWSGTLLPDLFRDLDDNSQLHAKRSVELCDNMSLAGRRAVFSIDKLLVNIDQNISGLKTLQRTHQWEELIRNAIR